MIKRMLLILILTLLLCSPVAAQTAIPPEADAEFEKFSDMLRDIELQYMRDYGRYVQTLTITPDLARGETKRPPCPTDDLACPVLTLTLTTIHVWINVYNGPGGPGYEVVALYTDPRSRVRFWRIENQGPETWRAVEKWRQETIIEEVRP